MLRIKSSTLGVLSFDYTFQQNPSFLGSSYCIKNLASLSKIQNIPSRKRHIDQFPVRMNRFISPLSLGDILNLFPQCEKDSYPGGWDVCSSSKYSEKEFLAYIVMGFRRRNLQSRYTR